jgi:hypothetical protein
MKTAVFFLVAALTFSMTVHDQVFPDSADPQRLQFAAVR